MAADVPLRFAPDLEHGLDLLFVVDDSDSMREEQDALAASFPAMISEFEAAIGVLPDLHIGVVTTDMGANDLIVQCGQSDNGAFQFTPSADCPLGDTFALDGSFLIDVADDTQPDGRLRNYSGQLQDAFSCIAKVGTLGCGFEMPLESMRQGLLNAPAGFLRPEAFLAVIFITDEDDCSTRDYGMFDTSDTAIDGPLGPLDSFRCFEFGVQCAGDDPRALGAKEECVPRVGSPYMFDVQEYVDFLTELKGGNRSQIIVGGIIGAAEPVEVSTRTIPATGETRPTLTPSCEGTNGKGFPAVRLDYFLRQFPGQNMAASICDESLAAPLTKLALWAKTYSQHACLQGQLRDGDPVTSGVQPQCEVVLVANDTETALPECVELASPRESSNLPCHVIQPDPGSCGSTDTGLGILVYGNADAPPASVARVVVRCQGN